MNSENFTITRWNVVEMSQALQRFDWLDYLVFVMMLSICIVIGIYFGFIKTVKTESDYLVGGRNMKMFPIAMSLTASFISGISLLGIPTEIYVYGTQYLYISIGILLMGIVFQNVYLPVFHNLKVTSTFEYLEKRFDRRIRIFGSLLSIIGIITWLPIVIYVPALAFNQVTGINVHLITPIVCLICIFYTCVGGLKAVVWTDVIQIIIMMGVMLLIAVKGTLDIGGIETVWESNWESERIEGPDFELNIFKRHTIWALAIGGFVYYLQTSSVNQSMIQRYLALPNLQTANRALWVFIFGLFCIICLCAYCGLLIYATYKYCDPITTQLAREKDQLLPLLVMDVLGNIPGFPGLFVSGIFCAALSSLSTGLNSLAAVILEDFYRPLFKQELSEKHKQIVMKSSVIIMGSIFVALVFVVEQLGTVLQLTMSIGTISAGPSLSLFTMGMLLPWINSTGALVGGLTSLLFMTWLTLSSHAAIATGNLKFEEKPVSTESCQYDFFPKQPPAYSLQLDENMPHSEEVLTLYGLSYLWYTLLGLVVSCSTGLIISLLCHPNDSCDIDLNLLSPIIRKWIPARKYPNQPPGPEEIILAYEKKSYELSTLSSYALPTYNNDILNSK